MSTKISPESGGDLPADLHEAIRQRAEEIYARNGKVPGRDIENWIQAEREIRREAAQRVARRTAVVVKIDGIDYVGEYALAEADGYKPGEFSSGDAVAVRFEEGKMYVKRPNGKELETRVVKTYS
jgi:hypothetical protein